MSSSIEPPPAECTAAVKRIEGFKRGSFWWQVLVRKKAINHFVCTGPPAPAHQQDHPPRRQRQQHPADDTWGDQTRWLRYVFCKRLTLNGWDFNSQTYCSLSVPTVLAWVAPFLRNHFPPTDPTPRTRPREFSSDLSSEQPMLLQAQFKRVSCIKIPPVQL